MPQDPTEILARTIWGEARSTGKAGMQHVASVILNRANNPRWWGDDVISVCQKPRQFSCWNEQDPNREKLLAVTEADPEFRTAMFIALQAHQLPDLTGGADSYYALSMATPPTWAAKATRTMVDGWHAFYRTELPAATSFARKPATADDLNAQELKSLDQTSS